MAQTPQQMNTGMRHKHTIMYSFVSLYKTASQCVSSVLNTQMQPMMNHTNRTALSGVPRQVR